MPIAPRFMPRDFSTDPAGFQTGGPNRVGSWRTVVDFGTMKRWHLIVAALVLASAVAFAQGRGQRGQGGGQARGGGGGGRGVQSTADLTVVDGWGNPVKNPLAGGKAPGPAPIRDISGTWEPAQGPGAGIQANGPVSMPSDGVHEPPF